MSRGPDANVLLERALLRDAAKAGCTMSVTGGSWERWASATFTGARHVFEISLVPREAADTWLSGLAEAELSLRGNLVADLVVERSRDHGEARAAELQILTVEER